MCVSYQERKKDGVNGDEAKRASPGDRDRDRDRNRDRDRERERGEQREGEGGGKKGDAISTHPHQSQQSTTPRHVTRVHAIHVQIFHSADGDRREKERHRSKWAISTDGWARHERLTACVYVCAGTRRGTGKETVAMTTIGTETETETGRRTGTGGMCVCQHVCDTTTRHDTRVCVCVRRSKDRERRRDRYVCHLAWTNTHVHSSMGGSVSHPSVRPFPFTQLPFIRRP